MDTTNPLRVAQKTLLAQYPSKSRPGFSYDVCLGADGNVYCSCPAWRFQHLHPSNRSCLHTKDAVARLTHGGVSLAAQGAVPLVKAVRPTRRPRTPVAPPPAPRTSWERISEGL